MIPTTTHLPLNELAARVDEQVERVGDVASAFVATVAAEGLGRAVPTLLRGVVSITCFCDLARLTPDAGQRISTLVEAHRAEIHREFNPFAGAAAIDTGLTAAIELVGLIGRSWAELEAIPSETMRSWAANAMMLANAIESAVLAAIVTKIEPRFSATGATGATLH